MIAVGESDYRDELARLTPSLRAFARALVEGHHEEVADELVQAALISVLGDRQAGNGLRLRLRLLATLLATHRRSVREAKADQDAGTQNKTAPHGTVRSGRWAATHRVVGRDAARLDEMPLECREILLLITLEVADLRPGCRMCWDDTERRRHEPRPGTQSFGPDRESEKARPGPSRRATPPRSLPSAGQIG